MIGRKKRRYRRRTLAPEKPDYDSWSLSPETKRTIIIIAIFTFSALGFLSLFNTVGPLGQWIKLGLSQAFGWADWLVLLLLLVLDYFLLFDEKYQFKKINYVGLALLWLSITGLMHFFVAEQPLKETIAAGQGGGYLGYAIGYNLTQLAGFAGGIIILSALLLAGLFIFFNTSFRQIIQRVRDLRFGIASDDFQETAESADQLDQPLQLEAEEQKPFSEEEEAVEEPEAEQSAEEKTAVTKRAFVAIKKIDLPLDLLTPASGKPTSGDIKVNGLKIQKALENFGIQVTMADVNVGPTVTQYTLKPDEGVKLSQITTLSDNLSLALAAHPIRIEAPIPGKALVGIEVPNQSVSIVRLRDILTSDVYTDRKSNLMITLGKDVTGRPVMADLGKMPHLLIAGATGSGKSVAINSIILSLLWQNSPSDLKFILIDPKRVELSMYNEIPHLLTGVINETKEAISALRWAAGEMDARYKLLAASHKRNIESYNSSLLMNRMPYIVIIIDELANIMHVAAKEAEAVINRLAAMARAVGIHLIIATQRPSVNVITGLIKGNINSRIAFAVPTQIDSRTIIDHAGAEKLLGNGDMLYTSAELSKPRRIQGAFVSEKEVHNVTDYLKEHGGKPEYDLSITQQTGHNAASLGEIDRDEEDLSTAAQLVVQYGRASTTFLQTRMRIGFSKAARLMDLLEERGYVSGLDVNKRRDVLVTEEDLKREFGGQADSQYESSAYEEPTEKQIDDYDLTPAELAEEPDQNSDQSSLTETTDNSADNQEDLEDR